MIIVAFLAWWAVAAWRAWRYPDAGPFARAASIATAALLAHSLVEFPLRTAALSACFAMGLAILVERRPRAANAPTCGRPGTWSFDKPLFRRNGRR